MLHFILNDRPVATDRPVGTIALDYLRDEQHLLGTREGCREGDCGACMVLLGEPQDGGMLSYGPAPACLLPIGELAGRHLVTIEGLSGDGLNPIQRALVDAGAVQCGYCTPGLVVALTAYILATPDRSTESALDAIGGNLCRCTGYAAVRRAVAGLCRRFPPQAGVRQGNLAALITDGLVPPYFAGVPEQLSNLQGEEASATDAEAIVVGGGTDLFVQRANELVDAPLSFLSNVGRYRGIRSDGDRCWIGAATTIEEIRCSRLLADIVPSLEQDLRLVCSAPIRCRATVGGNLVNASPIGDLIVLFLALGATVELESPSVRREIALHEFFPGYRRTVLQRGEIVAGIHFARPLPDARVSFEKVAKRRLLDIAAVNTAMAIRVSGGVIESIGLSAGGVAPTPVILRAAEEYLHGKPATVEHVQAAVSIAQAEIAPISDIRGSAEYKRLLLRQLLYAHFLKTCPTRVHAEDLR
jgi:xanthine dehydrogenase small subunit